MPASGSAYPRFRRVLDNGNLLAARACPTKLQHVGLAEALELTFASAPRHARYCTDTRASLEEATAVLGPPRRC